MSGHELMLNYVFNWSIPGQFFFTIQWDNTHVKFADNWIWTEDLWCQKQLLCQLSHIESLISREVKCTFSKVLSLGLNTTYKIVIMLRCGVLVTTENENSKWSGWFIFKIYSPISKSTPLILFAIAYANVRLSNAFAGMAS